jgi:hypothetical protein
MRPDDIPTPEHDPEIAALFASLPREAPGDPRAADRLVVRLRHEGFFARRARYARWPIAIAAAVALLALSAWGGWVAGRRGSLEEMLSRTDLTVGDRVLLLQRAGSAYVTAAQSYASATARTDTTAIEVASRVLLGAAHAVARNHLDAGVAARLTSVLQPPAAPSRPTIWF